MKTLKLTALCATVFIATIMLAQPAVAGVYSNKLSRCLVSSTTPGNKQFLIKWMFSVVSTNPAIASYSTFTDAQRDQINQHMATLLQKLLTQSCSEEARKTIKYEGLTGFRKSFNMLGQVAGRAMFSDPAVHNAVKGFTKYLDTDALQKALGNPD